jgi:hypothetical protein
MSVVSLADNKLDYIKRQIIAGHERANKGGAEWVEGSLIVAAALREGRESIPSNITFKDWLKQNNLDFYSHHARAALVNLASNIELARTILTETDSRSYERIWSINRSRFTSARKTRDGTDAQGRYRKPRTRNMNRAMIHRRMKLGDEIIDSIKGTSLDSAPEMDELVMLNRGAPEGELTEIVQDLVARAVSGEDVSAIALTARIAPISTRKRPSLIEAWRKRMVFAWDQANYSEQEKFIDYLMKHMKEHAT